MKIAAYLIEKIGSTVSGYFHPSLWLSESHELLVAQGDHGIDAHSAARGNVRGEQRDGREQCGDAGEGQEVSSANAEDRKSTRLNSSHRCISYAVFCLKKKKNNENNKHTHVRRLK